MIETATGLVLRTRLLTETSLIVNWLTPDLGRLSTVAKGARRPKSPFRGKLDLFYFADFSFTRSQRSDLHNLREVNLRETNAAMRRELICLEQASYCAALIEHATETETPLPSIFSLFKEFLDRLQAEAPVARNVFTFELKLLTELGLAPEIESTGLSPGSKELARRLEQSDWATGARFKLSAAQITELREYLHGYLIFHLGRIPQSRAEALRA